MQYRGGAGVPIRMHEIIGILLTLMAVSAIGYLVFRKDKAQHDTPAGQPRSDTHAH